MRRGVCIIECLDEKTDPGSEGRALKEVFNLMEVESKLATVTSINELLETIAQSKFQHIHISAHGAVSKAKRFRGWWTPHGSGTKQIVGACEIKLTCTSIVSTACRSGAKEFARYITNEWGSKYYIAPAGSPRFYNALLFSHIYYHKLFKTKGTVAKAFASYAETYKNPHGFAIYKRSAI